VGAADYYHGMVFVVLVLLAAVAVHSVCLMGDDNQRAKKFRLEKSVHLSIEIIFE
jgi:hypothetical protein